MYGKKGWVMYCCGLSGYNHNNTTIFTHRDLGVPLKQSAKTNRPRWICLLNMFRAVVPITLCLEHHGTGSGAISHPETRRNVTICASIYHIFGKKECACGNWMDWDFCKGSRLSPNSPNNMQKYIRTQFHRPCRALLTLWATGMAVPHGLRCMAYNLFSCGKTPNGNAATKRAIDQDQDVWEYGLYGV